MAHTCKVCPVQMVPNVSQKTCKKCHVEKPAEEFPRNKLTNDGLHSYCKCVPQNPHTHSPDSPVDHMQQIAGYQSIGTL